MLSAGVDEDFNFSIVVVGRVGARLFVHYVCFIGEARVEGRDCEGWSFEESKT